MSERDQVLKRAFELQAEEEAEQAEALATEELHTAAQDVGLDPDYLARAERELEQKKAKRQRLRRVLVITAAAAVATGALATGAVRLLSTPAPDPWTQTFDDPAGWTLDTNPGTKASVRFDEARGRGKVAVLDVQSFAVQPDGSYRVNLNNFAVPANAADYKWLSVDVKGDLPVVRVYLEAGPGERWRSPAIRADASWKQQRIPLESFEHQRREGGSWISTDSEPPTNLSQVSIKVGHYMNAPDAKGSLALDNLRLE